MVLSRPGHRGRGRALSLLPHLVRLLRGLRDPAAPDAVDHLAKDGTVYLQLDDGRHLALPAERVRAIVGTLIELNDASALRDDGRLDLSLDHAGALAQLEASGCARWRTGSEVSTASNA